MAAVATAVVGHTLALDNDEDKIGGGLAFRNHSVDTPLSSHQEVGTSQSNLEAQTENASTDPYKTSDAQRRDDNAVMEATANSQLEGAADEVVEAGDGSESEDVVAAESMSSGSDKEASAIVGSWEAASAEEASLEHAIRDNCV